MERVKSLCLFRASRPGDPLALAFTLPVTGNSPPPKLSPPAYSSDWRVTWNGPALLPGFLTEPFFWGLLGTLWGPEDNATCQSQLPGSQSTLLPTVYSTQQPLKAGRSPGLVSHLSGEGVESHREQ